MGYEIWSRGISDFFVGNMFSVLFAIGVVVMFFVAVGLYIYFSFAWMRIAEKLKYKKAWLAWIPVANLAMMLQLGGFKWGWVFLIVIPVIGWIALFVLVLISTWRIFEKRKYPGWFSLSMIIPQIGGVLYLIAIGFAAWKDRSKPVRF